MLIITADDYGMTRQATENILECFRSGSITCASGMVFMEDSERAATEAKRAGFEIGLHLNLSSAFTGKDIPRELCAHQARISAYLNRHRFAQAVFHPGLTAAFRHVVSSQCQEFEQLYGGPPVFINGHHHMHLSANVIYAHLLPSGVPIRGTFTFRKGEKSFVNRLYRDLLTAIVRRKFMTPDCLYSIEPIADTQRIRGIAEEAALRTVELEVHPERVDEKQFLLSSKFQDLIDGVSRGGFRSIANRIERGTLGVK